MKSKGFTLIELMIVLAVLGILAAIAVPQLQKFFNRRNATVEFQQQPGQFTQPAPIQQPLSAGSFKIITKAVIGNQEVYVFEYGGETYIMNYSGGIVKHK